MEQITILNKDRTVRIVRTSSKDNVAIGQAFEGDNYLVSVSGDRLLTPAKRPVKKEKTDKKEVKAAKKEWKQSIILAYPQESGSANQIAKRHYQINQTF